MNTIDDDQALQLGKTSTDDLAKTWQSFQKIGFYKGMLSNTHRANVYADTQFKKELRTRFERGGGGEHPMMKSYRAFYGNQKIIILIFEKYFLEKNTDFATVGSKIVYFNFFLNKFVIFYICEDRATRSSAVVG